ncbi:uncharacterized protein LOC129891165 [Solanum dulcamara]|uniref:uncharacterized protein LOC129891165 n=1 Tax=Solanum dulcamara TaxID=45834 RepID=UPI002485A845|nr:uncharacterized protein LOC129891165 [Solanum dulcamara]
MSSTLKIIFKLSFLLFKAIVSNLWTKIWNAIEKNDSLEPTTLLSVLSVLFETTSYLTCFNASIEPRVSQKQPSYLDRSKGQIRLITILFMARVSLRFQGVGCEPKPV